MDEPGDPIRLKHMLEAAREAQAFAQGKARADLDRDRMLEFALVRAIEIIGEAAAQVTKDSQARCSSIPWAQVIAMRNRLIHAYFSINLDILWDTVEHDLPPLILELERIIGPVSAGGYDEEEKGATP